MKNNKPPEVSNEINLFPKINKSVDLQVYRFTEKYRVREIVAISNKKSNSSIKKPLKVSRFQLHLIEQYSNFY